MNKPQVIPVGVSPFYGRSKIPSLVSYSSPTCNRIFIVAKLYGLEDINFQVYGGMSH